MSLTNAHHALQRQFDRGLEFLWQWAGVKRRHLFTAALVLWQGSYIVERAFSEKAGSYPWWLLLVIAFLGAMNWFMWHQEVKFEKADQLELFNGRLIQMREYQSRIVFMGIIWVMGLVFLTLSVLSGVIGDKGAPGAIASALGDIGFVVYPYAYDTLVPMGPRKKIKLPKLSLPKIEVLAPAPAYGGAWK